MNRCETAICALILSVMGALFLWRLCGMQAKANARELVVTQDDRWLMLQVNRLNTGMVLDTNGHSHIEFQIPPDTVGSVHDPNCLACRKARR